MSEYDFSDAAASRIVPVVNGSGADCPPGGCLQIVAPGTVLDSSGCAVYQCVQPNGATSPAGFLFNTGSTIPAGGPGGATMDFPCQALWDTGTPSVGDTWGPKAGQWSLTKGGSPGFPVLGIINSGSQWMKIGPLQPAGGIPFYNASGVTIPAWGCFKASAMSAGVLQAAIYDTTLVPTYYLNGSSAVLAAGSGTALDFGDVTIGTLAASIGDGWGPSPTSFSLAFGNPMTLRVFGDDGTNCRGNWGQIGGITVKVGSGGISAFNSSTQIVGSGTGQVVWANSSTGAPTQLTATTFTATIYNLSTTPIGGSTFIQAIPINGKWYAVSTASAGTLFGFAVTSGTATAGSTSAVSISSITPCDGSTDSSTSVNNPMGMPAANGATVMVAKNLAGSTYWFIVQVFHVAVSPMTLWTPADPNIGMTYQPAGIATGGVATTSSTYAGKDCTS